jgi:dienelactone hydrolase
MGRERLAVRTIRTTRWSAASAARLTHTLFGPVPDIVPMIGSRLREYLRRARELMAAVRDATPGPAVRRLAALAAALAIAWTCSLSASTSPGSTGLRSLEPGPSNADAATVAAINHSRSASNTGTGLPADTTVGLRVITFVDHTRTERLRDGRVEPRTLVTQIRYPAIGSDGADDVPDAAPLSAAGPFPLVAFGHGFAETPTAYARLLDAWVRAGYVVAAPLFPLTQKYVPGGRREADLINQPGDISFVISRVLADNRLPASFLRSLIAPQLIAVAGHSDGAATVLADAYDPDFADPRVRAAIILSGAELSLIDDSIAFPASGPPLLATQGSRDTLNEPEATQRYFGLAPRPKFLLTLIGATHLPPYTTEQPYLGVVEHVTIAFLDHFLKHTHASLARMRESGNVAGIARLIG